MEIDWLTCNTDEEMATGAELTFGFFHPYIWLKNIGNGYATKVFLGMLKTEGLIQPQLLPLKPTGNPSRDNPSTIDDATCKNIVQNPRYTSFPIYAGQEWKFDSFRQGGVAQKPPLGKDVAVRLVFPWCVGYWDDYDISHATCITYDFVPSEPIEDGSTFFTCGNGKRITGTFRIALSGHCEN